MIMKKLIFSFCMLMVTSIGSSQNWNYLVNTGSLGYTSTIKLGYSVDLDSNFIIVGAPGHNNNTGAVFVLQNDGYNLISVALLTASDGEVNDQFGISVRISNNTIVVGAMGDDDNGTDAGAAYVFEKPISGWADMTETAKLKASDGEAGDIFGKSVSIYQSDIVIGAHLDDDNGADAGAAYVFEKPISGWVDMTETAKLLPSDGAANESFGHSVSVYGNTVVIGAMWDDDNGTYSGSAYIFEKPIGGWSNVSETAKLLPSNGSGWNYFGNFVDIYANDVIIGSGSNQGYVFTKPISGWVNTTETAILIASDSPVDWFANAVSIDENTIVLGAERDDETATDAGAIYIYEKPLNGWSSTVENQKINDFITQDDYFGHAVSVFNNKIAVGAYNRDVLFGFTVGGVYLYENCNDYISIDTAACNSYMSNSGQTYITSSVFNDTLTNQNGCDSIVTTNLTINYSDTVTDQINACFSYTWIDGNTYFNDNDSATFTLVNMNGCDSIVNLNLTINNVDVTITQNVITLVANSNSANYQWLDCDNNMIAINGANNQIFTPVSNGNYAVEITENGCVDTSSCAAITEVSINEFSKENIISISPNPTFDVIYLKNYNEIKEIEIYNSNGKLINTWNSKVSQIDISAFQKGFYILRIVTEDNKSSYFKIVKL